MNQRQPRPGPPTAIPASHCQPGWAPIKAAAALWTADGEYIGADGEAVGVRAEIERGLAAYFKANPKATIEVRVESVRAMGRELATAGASLR